MSGGVADDIRLGLDDPAARYAFRKLPHYQFADEISGKRRGIGWKFGARQNALSAIAASHFQTIGAKKRRPGMRGRD